MIRKHGVPGDAVRNGHFVPRKLFVAPLQQIASLVGRGGGGKPRVSGAVCELLAACRIDAASRGAQGGEESALVCLGRCLSPGCWNPIGAPVGVRKPSRPSTFLYL